MSGFEFEIPLVPSKDQLRELEKQVMKEKLQVIEGAKEKEKKQD